MVTLLREEMAINRKVDDDRIQANRKADEEARKADRKADKEERREASKADKADREADRKIDNERFQQMQEQMQTQMKFFQQLITPLLDKEASKQNKTQSSDSGSIHSDSHSADTTVTQTTHHEHNTRSRLATNMSTPERHPPALNRLTQPTDNLTRTPPDLFTQPGAAGQPPESNDALMHEQQPHIKPNSSGLTPPPKKIRSAQKRILENRKLSSEFEDVQSFQESADSQGAAGGGL